MKHGGGYIAIAGLGASFILAALLLLDVINNGAYETSVVWIPGVVNMGVLFDNLSVTMLFMVTLVSLLIHIFSLGYMHGDTGLRRYFAELNLFTASMIILVISNNFLGIFIGFELVGLCSYLLIGFWHFKPTASSAAKKAFLVTRFGDAFFMAGIFMVFAIFEGHMEYSYMSAHVESVEGWMVTLAAILIFGGVVGKSAQFPLHTWLPDAMEGPTTVSALIHAATMVAAGVYMVARVYPLFFASPTALAVVAFIGGFTALFAATMAVAATDIKKILAYSTISQYGYIALGLGVSGYTAAVFHLINHAFFKALLFLAAGSIIHGLSGEQNIFRMGALSRKMKVTVITFVVGALSLSGIPPFNGFFSKDEILVAAFSYENIIPFMMGMFTVFLTSFYIFRLVFVGLLGEKKTDHHAHESPLNMIVPLSILAFLCVASGIINLPAFGEKFNHFIHFEGIHADHSSGALVTAMSLGFALIGIGVAYLFYSKGRFSAENVKTRFLGLHKLLSNRYYIDYHQDRFGLIWFWGFTKVLDKYFDKAVIDGIIDGISAGIVRASSSMRRIETGQVQTYASMVVVGVFVILFTLWMVM